MKHTKNTVIKHSIESRELMLFAVNESVLYEQIKSVIKCLARYYNKGLWNPEKGIDAFYPVATRAAALYSKYYGDGGQMFTVTERYTAAAEMLDYFQEDITE